MKDAQVHELTRLMSGVEIYKDKENQTQIEVRFEDETVWLNQQQMALLFNQTKQNISLHINNCFKENELSKKAVVKESLTTASDGKRYTTTHYNLDVIISVGYRIKSKRGTQFRQWATQRLKDLLVRGYILNQRRLQQVQRNMQELEATIKKIQLVGNSEQLNLKEAKGLLEIISNYTYSFILLNQFDTNRLGSDKLNENITYEIQYNEALSAIAELKRQLIKKKPVSFSATRKTTALRASWVM